MSSTLLYPLRFEPIYQYRLWGGRRLAGLLTPPLPGDGPIGEAWVLSDRDDHPSRVANGPLKGRTISQLLDQFPEQLLGKLAHPVSRFPLLLKFLDAREMLSVQVHPADTHTDLLPPGETGKTEAWVVLEAGPKSRIYAGQQNSDVTFRLYDWGHVDAQTGQPRALQVDQALACIDFAERAAGPVAPVVEVTAPVSRERLFDCEYFRLWRLRGHSPFSVGAAGVPRVLICSEGEGQMERCGTTYAVGKGEVWLLPAAVGACTFQPRGRVNLLEIALPVTE